MLREKHGPIEPFKSDAIGKIRRIRKDGRCLGQMFVALSHISVSRLQLNFCKPRLIWSGF